VLDVPVKSATISAEGDVDLRGTLGVTQGVPVGFKEIRLHFVSRRMPRKATLHNCLK